ncbi:esterase [Pseudonocardia sp. K10HN5]|uniref:Esterase n=2 Tax=Pseudonocardia acidicola TaxID=2724939 RepID=A0ABX1SIY1_9PSEU|nr:esterase [Pseudonocardia acidicola]
MAFLLVRRGRRWWRWVVPACVGGALLAVAAADAVLAIWQPFPDALPIRILVWAAVMLLAIVLAVANWWSAPWWRRAATVPAVLLVLAVVGVKINAVYEYRPTLGAVLGVPAANEIDLGAVARNGPVVTPGPGEPVSRVWRPPPGMPPTGKVALVDIPAPVSGFAARPASVYLPPAYLVSPRPLLPVLVLVAGQPGVPQDWLLAGRMAGVLDRFAARHAGLAPIVVMPDATGSSLANPLCLDSRLGNAETYLADDVPAWVAAHLQADPDPRHRAIGGFSYGGTCALQLAVRRPLVYPTFLDISGQDEPSLGGRAKTVAATYGGDDTRFRAVNPLDILAGSRFPDSTGIVAVGRDDDVYGPQAARVVAAVRRAGMQVELLTLPGRHSWDVATGALETALPRLAARMGLVDP